MSYGIVSQIVPYRPVPSRPAPYRTLARTHIPSARRSWKRGAPGVWRANELAPPARDAGPSAGGHGARRAGGSLQRRLYMYGTGTGTAGRILCFSRLRRGVTPGTSHACARAWGSGGVATRMRDNITTGKPLMEWNGLMMSTDSFASSERERGGVRGGRDVTVPYSILSLRGATSPSRFLRKRELVYTICHSTIQYSISIFLRGGGLARGVGRPAGRPRRLPSRRVASRDRTGFFPCMGGARAVGGSVGGWMGSAVRCAGRGTACGLQSGGYVDVNTNISGHGRLPSLHHRIASHLTGALRD